MSKLAFKQYGRAFGIRLAAGSREQQFHPHESAFESALHNLVQTSGKHSRSCTWAVLDSSQVCICFAQKAGEHAPRPGAASSTYR